MKHAKLATVLTVATVQLASSVALSKAPTRPKKIEFASLPEGAPEPTFSLERPAEVHASDRVDYLSVAVQAPRVYDPEVYRKTSMRGAQSALKRKRPSVEAAAVQPGWADVSQVTGPNGLRCLRQLGQSNESASGSLRLAPGAGRDVVPVRTEWLVHDETSATLEVRDTWIDTTNGGAKEAGRQTISMKLVALGRGKEPVYGFRAGQRVHLVFPVENNASITADDRSFVSSACGMAHVVLDGSEGRSSVLAGTFFRPRVLPWQKPTEKEKAQGVRSLTFSASASRTASDNAPVLSVVVADPNPDVEEQPQIRDVDVEEPTRFEVDRPDLELLGANWREWRFGLAKIGKRHRQLRA